MSQLNSYVQFLFMLQIPAMDTARALLKEPFQCKLLAKFDETCSAEGINVHLVYGSSKLKPECRVYKMPNNSLYLLEYPRTGLSSIMPHIINPKYHQISPF